MEFRQFKLINEIGAEYDLIDPTHFFAYPDGLGFEREFSVMQTGDVFVSLENKLRQQKVTGEMIFLDYEKYSEFRKFIANQMLTLAYRPVGMPSWYYRSCKVESLKKSEISSSTGRLHCNVDFICFSQWYESVTAERTIYEVSENSVFPLTFPFTFVDRNINEVVISNTNSSQAPCRIEILGPCLNPRWVLLQNGSELLNGKVLIALNEGESLIVDSNVETMRIVKVTDGEESDAYQYSDFSTNRFVYAPPGESLLRFYHDFHDANAPDEILDVLVEVRKVSDTV